MLCKSFIGSDDAVSPGISLIIRESSDQSATAPWSQAEITQRDRLKPQEHCVRVYWGDLVMLVVTANINCNYGLLFAHAIKLIIKTVCECILNYSSTLLICWLAFMHSGWWETLIVVDFCSHVFLFTSRLCPVIWVCFHELTNAIFSPATWAISAAFLVPPWPL